MVLVEYDVKKAVEVNNKNYFLKNVGNTFHGRDIFSPVAARLAAGIKFRSLGPTITLKKAEGIFVNIAGETQYHGSIIYIDRFGNLVTNFKMEKITSAELKIKEVGVPLKITYGEVREGEFVAYIGSSGLIEIAVRNGNVQKMINAGYGTTVELIIK